VQVQEQPAVDSLSAKSGQFIDTIKNLIHEGNVRKITIKQDDRTIAEFPLTFGVIGAAIAPALAAIGAITALVTDCTIEVERADA
jgi:integral membrane sensor domain MASE1